MFQSKSVQRPFKSIDLVILVFVFFWTNTFSSPNLMGCWFLRFVDDFPFFSIPHAPSRSNHYVDKVGGYHKVLIYTLHLLNAFPWIEMCPFFSILVDPSSPITPCYWTVCITCLFRCFDFSPRWAKSTRERCNWLFGCVSRDLVCLWSILSLVGRIISVFVL